MKRFLAALFSLAFFSAVGLAMDHDFYAQVSKRCFGEKSSSLQEQLDNYFLGVDEYRDVANMASAPAAISDTTEIINFLEAGLDARRGKEPLLPDTLAQDGLVVFATSGLDVMAERLVFLARHSEWWSHATRFVALVSNHAHRNDLLDRDYLHELPGIFYKTYRKESAQGEAVLRVIEQHLTQKDSTMFTHRDGMELILDMLSCVDEKIAAIKNKWSFYSKEKAQMDSMINSFFAEEAPNAAITFVCTPFGSNSIKQIVSKIDSTRNVQFAISGDLELDAELALHRTPPAMHINNLLFNLRKRLVL